MRCPPFPREQALPTIQMQLQREAPDYSVPADLAPGSGSSSKSSGGLPKSISKLTSKFTKKASSHAGGGGGGGQIVPFKICSYMCIQQHIQTQIDRISNLTATHTCAPLHTLAWRVCIRLVS